MTSVTRSSGFAALRRLAQLSIFFAMASLVATAAALVLLPNAVALGQWILIADPPRSASPLSCSA
jgi:hypothetical protein